MNDIIEQNKPSTEGTVRVVYILYLISLVFPITAIVGIVLAYINIDDAPDWLKSHYRFQIRTFWIGALYLVLSGLLWIVLIGYLILVFTMIWIIVRCAKGIKYVNRQQEYPNVSGWMF